MTHMLTRTLHSVLLTGALFLFQLSAQASTINKNYDLDAGGTLYFKTNGGSIKVETHDKNEVTLSADLQNTDPDDLEITHRITDDTLSITAKHEKKRWSNARIIFTLTVPDTLNLDLNTSGGSIKIDDLVGQVDAHTSGGSIRVNDIEGNIDLHTSGGSIDIGDIAGNAEISTSGGSIKIESVSGNLDAHTSGGSISATLTTQITEDTKLSTSGGSINLYVPNDIQFDLDASTSGGRVKSDFSVDGTVKKRAIKGEVNGGGPTIRLKSSGGTIRVIKD